MDAGEIAKTARRYGAEVPFYRSESTAGDYATTNDVLLEVLAEYEKRGEHYELGCCIYPTAPFVTADKLRDAMERLESSGADTLIPVVAFSYPPQRAMLVKEGRSPSDCLYPVPPAPTPHRAGYHLSSVSGFS